MRFGCDIEVIRNSVMRSCSGPEHSLDEGVLAAADQCGIEIRLGFQRGGQIALGERGLQPRQRIANSPHHVGIAQAGAFASGKSFEHGAGCV